MAISAAPRLRLISSGGRAAGFVCSGLVTQSAGQCGIAKENSQPPFYCRALAFNIIDVDLTCQAPANVRPGHPRCQYYRQ